MGNLKLETTNGSITLVPEDGTGNVDVAFKRGGVGQVLQVAYAVTAATQYTISSADLAAIPGLSIDFTPKRSDSLLILDAMINSNGLHVSSYGFLADDVSVYTHAVGTNVNTLEGISTTYYGGATSANAYMYNQRVVWHELQGNTNEVTYEVGACASWSGTSYNLFINDRTGSDMRSLSTFMIWEIAQ